MSNGYLVAAGADLAQIGEISEGLGLDIIAAHSITDPQAVGAALASAANVGVVLSMAAARDDGFVALLRALATQLPRAQIILVEPDALRAFAFLPALWPTMSLEDAQARAAAMLQGRQPANPAEDAPPPPVMAAPEAQAPEPAAAPVELEPAAATTEPQQPEAPADLSAAEAEPRAREAELDQRAGSTQAATPDAEPLSDTEAQNLEQPKEAAAPAPLGGVTESEELERAITIEAAEPEAPALDQPMEAAAPPAPARAAPHEQPPPATETPVAAPAPVAPQPARKRRAEAPASAPADATAFAPKKLRRGEAELVRIAIHQPKDLQAVIKAARKADPRTNSAPQSMGIGEVALGASVGVALEVKGAACDGAVQRRTWEGEPLEFSFAATADAEVKQVVILARVFVDDAQIGVLAFTRGVAGPRPKALPDGERVRLKRHKYVFLSYSSTDRETVAAIATAYQMAGVAHFWDRASLKSGEEWSPRLRREIEGCDLFHLCWSKAAAGSQWVEKETSHAIGLRRRKQRPDISVQMLDGPPWAKHPDSLDSINFDDFVRAAIVGYARGDGEG